MVRRTRRAVAAAALSGLLLASLLSGCSSEIDTEQEDTSTVPVEAQTLALQDFNKVITLGGLTAAENTVSVIAKVSGMEQILAVNVKVGDKVTEGQVLARLDDETSRINVDNAQLAVENAQNSISLAQQSYDNAVTNYNNGLELFDIGAMSQSDLDQLKLARDNAESQLNSAKISVANAQNTLESAQLALDYATVTAPISGTVTMVNANVGSYATASAPMFEIANVETLEISAGINEQNVGKVHVGQEVLLKVSSVSDEQFSGVITEISKVMNSQTKNYPITIALRNQDETLVAGMYAEIRVVVDRAENVLVVPVQAIVYKEAQPIAYTVQPDGTVQERRLTLGLNDGDNFVVTEGLSAGDQIVVTGNSNLVDGEAVTVVTLDGVPQELDLAPEEADGAQAGGGAEADGAEGGSGSEDGAANDGADAADGGAE